MASHLIYGDIPESSGAPGKDAGVITVGSELDPRIRQTATTIMRLPDAHEEILSEPATLERVQEFLRKQR